MMLNSGWAPLVHGRTLHADFPDKLHAVPGDIWATRRMGGETAFGWVRSVVNNSLTDALRMDRRRLVVRGGFTPEQLAEKGFGRWVLAKNDVVCLFGIACMAHEVFPIHPSRCASADYAGEEIPVFLGYASLLDGTRYPLKPHHPAVPALGDLREMGYEAMRPLFDYVARRWRDTAYRASHDPQLTDANDYPLPTRTEAVGPAGVEITPDEPLPQRVRLWPPGRASDIWAAAATAAHPVTLCVGVSDEHEAKRLRFQQSVLRSSFKEYADVPFTGQVTQTQWNEVEKQLPSQTRSVQENSHAESPVQQPSQPLSLGLPLPDAATPQDVRPNIVCRWYRGVVGYLLGPTGLVSAGRKHSTKASSRPTTAHPGPPQVNLPDPPLLDPTKCSSAEPENNDPFAPPKINW